VLDALEGHLSCPVRIVTSTDARFSRTLTRTYGESPEAGLARQHAEQGKVYAAVRHDHHHALVALAALGGAHEKLLQEHQAMTQLLAEQRARNDWNTQVRTDLHADQDTCGESTRRPSPGSAERPERISKRWRACGRRPPRFGQPRRSWRPRMPPSGPSWTRMSSGPTPSGHAMRSVRE